MHFNTVLTKEFLTDRLINNHGMVMKVAAEVGCCKHLIIKYCRKHGIYEQVLQNRKHPNKIDLIGKRYGSLLVIAEAESLKGHCRWLCKCDCGKTKLIVGISLRKGLTKTCGMCARKNFTGYKDVSGSMFRKMRNACVDRGLEFSITPEDIWNVYEKQDRKCNLSGLEIFFKRNQDKGILQTASVDRIDSNIGYTKDNIQIVHKRLNLLKNKAHNDEFLAWCRLVYLANQDYCNSIKLDVNLKNWEDR